MIEYMSVHTHHVINGSGSRHYADVVFDVTQVREASVGSDCLVD